MARKPTAATLEAMMALDDIDDKVYNALSQIFSEEDVLDLMNGGFKRALKDLTDETYKLTDLVTDKRIWKANQKKKGLI
ncbi:MAG: hypothetical protein SOY69_06110 [Alloprevotella sp.]|nr:hypothetical protein [Alloprevotella sp.]